MPKTPLMIRSSKMLVTAAMAFLFTLIVFGNVTDYPTNFAFVRHVLLMDTTFPDASIRSRAITSTDVQTACYLLIIATEALTAVLLWAGVICLLRRLTASPADFGRAKGVAVAGLTTGYLLWQAGIFAIGNEWFGMWMSREWNGVESVFRFVVMTLGALIFVSLPEAAHVDEVPGAGRRKWTAVTSWFKTKA